MSDVVLMEGGVVTIPHVYIAYHVNLDGTTEANYHLQATDDESAIKEARQYLASHESIEIWNGSRSVARLKRDVG
jgi:hypothetical protein